MHNIHKKSDCNLAHKSLTRLIKFINKCDHFVYSKTFGSIKMYITQGL